MYANNVGAVDRAVRLMIAAALLPVGLLPLGGVHGRPIGIVAIVVAAAAFVTALSGRCPGYVPFGIDTRRRHAGGRDGGEEETSCTPT